jgi:glycosyltransferase involved in cell wall biosynthesis
VVDLFSGPAFLWGEALSILLSRLGVPFVISLHGGALPEFAAERKARVRACLARAAAVTAPSPYLRETMRAYRWDIRLIPNPLELGSFPHRTREALKPELVWVRGFHQMYNPALAVQVVARLAAEFPEIRLTMVGGARGDNSLEETRRLAVAMGIPGRVAFTGPVPRHEVPAWISRADIFLNTTNVDNTPVSMLEAMACGLCVVTTDAGGIPYLVEDGRDAVVVPRNDADRMADAVRRLLRDSAAAGRISRHARMKAQQFDWAVVLPQWQELLQSVSEGRGSRRRAAAAEYHPGRL